MKKTTLILSALLVPVLHIAAQSFYVKAGGGYGFPLAGQTVNPSNNELYSGSMSYDMATGNVVTYKINAASMTAGIQGVVGAGMLLNSNIGIELDAVLGLSTKKNSSVTTFPYRAGSTLISVSEKYTMSAKLPILLSPALTIQSNGNIKVYSRAGLLLPVKTSVRGEFTGTETAAFYSASHYEGVQEFKTKFGIGFTGALGVSANTAIDWLKVWAEVNFNILSLYASERTFTEYTIDGHAGNISPQLVHITYQKEGTNATARPSFTIPFNSAGAMAGISFMF